MDAKEDRRSTRIQRGILERIELLNSALNPSINGTGKNEIHMVNHTNKSAESMKGSTASPVADAPTAIECEFSLPKAEKPSANPGISIWDITGNIKVIGQCWDNKTEPFSGKNNIAEVCDLLDERYGSKYIVYSFTKNAMRFKRAQFYRDASFSLADCLEIARTSACWLSVIPDGKIIIELQRAREDAILFFLSAMLAFGKMHRSAECAFGSIMKMQQQPFSFASAETALRYVKYFDLLLSGAVGRKCPKLSLRQVILTAAARDMARRDQRPVLRIKSEEAEEPTTDNCYVDENFIIFNAIDKPVKGDVSLILYLEKNNVLQQTFRLMINSHFYQQGLYRFTACELECSAESGSALGKDFFLDLVFTDSSDQMHACPFITEQNFVHDISTLSNRMPVEFSNDKLQVFIGSSYNRILAKFCAQMDFSVDEAAAFVNSLEAMGYRNLIFCAKPVNIPQLQNALYEASRPEIVLRRPFVEAAACISTAHDEEDGCVEINDIPLITERATETADVGPAKRLGKGGLRSFFNKKTAEPVAMPEVVATQPLHWVPLAETKETIFEDIKDIDAGIDFKKFEDTFCEPLKAVTGSKAPSAPLSALGDCKRLFLASLSIKHLELRGITPQTLSHAVDVGSGLLSTEDLHNIERSLLTAEERCVLERVPVAQLSPTEKTMLEFSLDERMPRIVQILIFERNFSEEIPFHEQALDGLLLAFNRMLDSNGLRIILKTVLDIGNAINYRYAIRRKKADGYRLESLYAFGAYAGKKRAGLFCFLAETLKKNGVDVESLMADLDPIHRMKNEDMAKIREKLNGIIAQYKAQQEVFAAMPSESQGKYRHILGQACQALTQASRRYTECSFYASLIRRKFGEEEKKPVAEILAALSDFLEKLCAESRLISNVAPFEKA